jgi:hypothetical protein
MACSRVNFTFYLFISGGGGGGGGSSSSNSSSSNSSKNSRKMLNITSRLGHQFQDTKT